MAGEITLDNHRLLNMARDQMLVGLLPCLDTVVQMKNSVKQAKKKSCCGNQPGHQLPNAEFDKVRKCIHQMFDKDEVLVRTVKKKLGANGIRVRYPGTNKTVLKKF